MSAPAIERGLAGSVVGGESPPEHGLGDQSHTSSVPAGATINLLLPLWLAEAEVEVGGVRVTYIVALEGLRVLAASTSMMVRQPLRSAGSPLWRCDYHAVAAPYRAAFLTMAHQGRGAAGRHLTKSAFMAALSALLAGAREEGPAASYRPAVRAALAAFTSDPSYSAAMATAAVNHARKVHRERWRNQLRQATHQAISACEARAGQFSCSAQAACGTGSCLFAQGALVDVVIAAPPGRSARPANHTSTTGYDASIALDALVATHPYRVGIPVEDGDSGHARDGAVSAV